MAEAEFSEPQDFQRTSRGLPVHLMTDKLERQAETIVVMALDLPAADRETAAVQACGGDVQLLRRVLSASTDTPPFSPTSTSVWTSAIRS